MFTNFSFPYATGIIKITALETNKHKMIQCKVNDFEATSILVTLDNSLVGFFPQRIEKKNIGISSIGLIEINPCGLSIRV